MTHDEFLQLVYERFQHTNQWPLVRELQVALRPLNVKLLAAEIGIETVVCEEQSSGVCFLQLEGLARCPKATGDIETFLAAIRFIAKAFVGEGPAPVTSEALRNGLNLEADALRRLGLILYRAGGLWSGGSWALDGASFSLNPDSDAVFFENVSTLEEFKNIRAKVSDDAISASQHRFKFSPTKPLIGSQSGRSQPIATADTSPEKSKMRVFISWSGDRSHKLAVALRDWLPSVIQAVQPYVSSEDLRKGRRWSGDIAKELEHASFGILCIVPGNADAPWLNFEAGALSKIVEDARVVPLLFGLQPSDLAGHPLSQFQSTVFEKADMLRLLRSVNELLGSSGLTETRLEKAFENWWPNLVRSVESVPDSLAPAAAPAAASRSSPLEDEQDLDDTEQKILAMWAKRQPDLSLQVAHVSGELKVTEQRAQFYLDELSKKKYLHAMYGMNRPTRYQIDHKGRQYLVRKGLS